MNTTLDLKPVLEKYFDEHLDEMLESLDELISIESFATEAAEGMPYGGGSAKALSWAEKFMGEKCGLCVKNYDNYAVEGQFCADEKPALTVLAHLDTVPDCEGWNYPTFKLTVADDGNYYGRGTIDDKGPAIAAMWAAKALKELDVPCKNFALVFGGGEEVGNEEDIGYYEKKAGFAPMVFTPDGSFPVLNCEKGMAHITFSGEFDDKEIVSIDGGTVINAIPGKCICERFVNGTPVTIEVSGKACHGSRPENGDNAVTKYLSEYTGNDLSLVTLKNLFPHGELDGSSLGLGFSDKISGKMTCALTRLYTQSGRVFGGIDIRFPIDKTLDEITEIVRKTLANGGFKIETLEGMEPHYVDENSGFVKDLLSVYEDIGGRKGECIAEGGITYVHNIEGGVAFGAEFPEEQNNMHGADEHISAQTFKLNFLMYAAAIAKLCE